MKVKDKKMWRPTCISIQFAHVPRVCTGKLSDLLSSHSQTGSQAWLLRQISDHIQFLSSSLPRFQGSSQQLRKEKGCLQYCERRNDGDLMYVIRILDTTLHLHVSQTE